MAEAILCVDDEPANLTVFAAAFEDHYTVHTALSAREAIKILRSRPIDLIISDQRMPEMTGVQLLEAIRPEYPDTVRMILTGFSDIEAIIQAINTGRVDHYITKPWVEDQLRVTIRKALELQAVQRRNAELVRSLEARVAHAREIRQIFEKYVPQSVVETLLRGGPQRDSLRGELRIAVAMFIRIPGFHQITAGVDPKAVARFLNHYFAAMCRTILDHKGMVNEFFAEGILASFGVPLSTLSNEDNAVQAAIAMVSSLEQINAEHAEPTLGRRISVGIGLNRGELIAGNIGGKERLKYGVMGDTVNVAARIQGLTRPDRSDILMAAGMKAWLDGAYLVEDLGPVALRGKSEPVEICRVLGMNDG